MLVRGGFMPRISLPDRFRARRSIAAISLVEMSIAAAFLLICSVGVFSTLTRMQRNAIVNRAMTNSDNILRSMIEQALSRGWDNELAPLDVLTPTIAGTTSPYNTSSNVADGSWRQWDPYRGINAVPPSDPVVPVYEDVNDATKNIPARLYRKVQYVTGTTRLLWVTLRLEYTIRGQLIAQDAWATRAAD